MDDRERLAFYPSRQDCLPGLLAQWGLPIGEAGSQIRAGNRPARPPRLPVARGGAWQAGRFRVRRLPAGPRSRESRPRSLLPLGRRAVFTIVGG
jgi:hypothetical protein